jgi:hypothetical protein
MIMIGTDTRATATMQAAWMMRWMSWIGKKGNDYKKEAFI